MFEEVLSSDASGIVKQFALRGIANNEAASGLERYRELATSLDQPGIVRRDAIRLILKFGCPADIELLRSIAREENPDTVDAAEIAVSAFEER